MQLLSDSWGSFHGLAVTFLRSFQTTRALSRDGQKLTLEDSRETARWRIVGRNHDTPSTPLNWSSCRRRKDRDFVQTRPGLFTIRYYEVEWRSASEFRREHFVKATDPQDEHELTCRMQQYRQCAPSIWSVYAVHFQHTNSDLYIHEYQFGFQWYIQNSSPNSITCSPVHSFLDIR